MPYSRRLNLTRPVNWSHPLNRGRAAWWLALPQWSGGNTWHDLCRRNHGTLTNGPTWRPASRLGGRGELALDGSDDFVNVSDARVFDLTGDFTIAAWFFVTSVSSSPGVVDKRRGDQSTPAWSWHIDSSARLKFQPNLGGASVDILSAAISLNAYTRGVITRAGSIFTWYVNAAASGTPANNAGVMATNTAAVTIGKRNDGGNFPGRIDDVTIYNRAFSASEVAADYDLSRRDYPGVLNRLRRAVYLPLVSTTVAAITDLEVDLFHTADAEVALTHTADDAVDLASVSDFEVALE